MDEPCVGAAIPRCGGTGHWGWATISVVAGPGLAVADGVGPYVAWAVIASPGGLGVNPQEG